MRFLMLLSFLFLLTACGVSEKEATSNLSGSQTGNTLTETKTPVPVKEIQSVEVIPPVEIIYDYDTTLWTDLQHLDASILIDMRYATVDNFVEEKMYECGRCFLRPEVARKIVLAQQMLQEGGLGLKMLDCYRPRPIQQKLWDKVPDARYVTPPSRGSMHNRGAAVDLTLVDKNGEQLDMGTPYDFFGKKAHTDFQDLPKEILARRKLLKETMAAVELIHIRTEWWHYSYKGKTYELSDMLWNCEGVEE